MLSKKYSWRDRSTIDLDLFRFSMKMTDISLKALDKNLDFNNKESLYNQLKDLRNKLKRDPRDVKSKNRHHKFIKIYNLELKTLYDEEKSKKQSCYLLDFT